LLWSMGQLAWFPSEEVNGPVAFFGFGIPMVLFGGTAAALWKKNERLLKCLGGTCTVLGFVWAFGLLALVAVRAGLFPVTSGKGEAWIEVNDMFLGFFIPMLLCAGTVVGILAEDEKTRKAVLQWGGVPALVAVVGSIVAAIVLHLPDSQTTK